MRTEAEDFRRCILATLTLAFPAGRGCPFVGVGDLRGCVPWKFFSWRMAAGVFRESVFSRQNALEVFLWLPIGFGLLFCDGWPTDLSWEAFLYSLLRSADRGGCLAFECVLCEVTKWRVWSVGRVSFFNRLSDAEVFDIVSTLVLWSAVRIKAGGNAGSNFYGNVECQWVKLPASMQCFFWSCWNGWSQRHECP